MRKLEISNKTKPKTISNYTIDLLRLIDTIRDVGISTPVNIPIIVFCGKQSAGKTSLIEALSGINLPRSAGTCTRTPLELRMTNSTTGFH